MQHQFKEMSSGEISSGYPDRGGRLYAAMVNDWGASNRKRMTSSLTLAGGAVVIG
jgi:hypothetical protein